MPGDMMALNEDTFVAVQDDAVVDSLNNGGDSLLSDSDMSDMGRLHLELDLLNAENEAVKTSAAQEMDPENENKLHLDLDLLNADQTTEEVTTVAEDMDQEQNDNKLHLELDLFNGDLPTEQQVTVDPEMTRNENDNESVPTPQPNSQEGDNDCNASQCGSDENGKFQTIFKSKSILQYLLKL